MKFKVDYREARDATTRYPEMEFKLAKDFSTKLYSEFGDFIKAIVLFGSAAKKKKKIEDIDILVIIDDVKVQFTEEIAQTYRIIAQKVIADVDPKRLHIQSMKFSSFWEYVRAGDPVATNILRYGVALVDSNFFDPLQLLLDQGRIRPTPESISTYFALAPRSQADAERHIMKAGIDLYWAVINSAHAALMHYGEVPPSPEHVAELMKKTLIKDKKISAESAKTMNEMYRLYKDLTNRTKKTFTGKEYDTWKKKVDKFVTEMDKFIRKNNKK